MLGAELSLIDRRILAAGWLFVLAYQMVFTCYALTAAYVRGAMSGSIRGAMSPVVQLMMLLSNGGIIAWIFVLDRTMQPRFALIGLAVCSVCSYSAMVLFNKTFEQIHAGGSAEVSCGYTCTHLLINSGLAFVTSWSTCVLLNHVCDVIASYTSLNTEYIIYIFIGAIFVCSSVWFCFDMFYFRRRTLLVFSPYLACLATTAAILWEALKLDMKPLVPLLTAVIAGLIWIMILSKLIANCVRSSKKRLKNRAVYKENGTASASHDKNNDITNTYL